MLIHDNLNFYNTAELLPFQDKSFQPIRVPQRVREKLSPMGQQRLGEPFGIEIRFVNENPEEPVVITLSSPDENPASLVPYWGELSGPNIVPIPDQPTAISIAPHERFHLAVEEHFANAPFSRNVCRLVLQGRSLRYHGISGGSLRPPRPEELPKQTLMTYGTSLTQGSCSQVQALTYPSLLGRFLGYDVLNLGAGGSCFCEKEIVDYLASLSWDAAILDPCANMMAQNYSIETFRERTAYLINRLVETHPETPILCISLIPTYIPTGEQPGRIQDFRNTLRELAEEAPGQVAFFNADDAINIYPNYSADLIHPSPHGYLHIAQILESPFKALLGRTA